MAMLGAAPRGNGLAETVTRAGSPAPPPPAAGNACLPVPHQHTQTGAPIGPATVGLTERLVALNTKVQALAAEAGPAPAAPKDGKKSKRKGLEWLKSKTKKASDGGKPLAGIDKLLAEVTLVHEAAVEYHEEVKAHINRVESAASAERVRQLKAKRAGAPEAAAGAGEDEPSPASLEQELPDPLAASPSSPTPASQDEAAAAAAGAAAAIAASSPPAAAAVPAPAAPAAAAVEDAPLQPDLIVGLQHRTTQPTGPPKPQLPAPPTTPVLKPVKAADAEASLEQGKLLRQQEAEFGGLDRIMVHLEMLRKKMGGLWPELAFVDDDDDSYILRMMLDYRKVRAAAGARGRWGRERLAVARQRLEVCMSTLAASLL